MTRDGYGYPALQTGQKHVDSVQCRGCWEALLRRPVKKRGLIETTSQWILSWGPLIELGRDWIHIVKPPAWGGFKD